MVIKDKYKNIILYSIIILGVGLSIFQFLFNRSLWLDESYLALNVMDRDFMGLLKPLKYSQVAPILFLEISKFFGSLFNYSEYSLRLFPLISFWAGIYYLYRTLKLLFKNDFTLMVTLLLFTSSIEMIHYSSEFKQYMTDVAMTNCMFYLTIRQIGDVGKKYLWLGIAGVIGVFISNVTPIIMTASGLYLIFEKLPFDKQRIKYLAFTFLAWGAMFFVNYIMFIYNHPTKDYMKNYWQFAFLPSNIFSKDFYLFLFSKSHMFYSYFYNNSYNWTFLFVFLMIPFSGLIGLTNKKNILTLILFLMPFILHLTLSAFKLYPFDTRLTLYLFPLTVILIGFGFNEIITTFDNRFFALISKVIIASIVVFLAVRNISSLPFEKSEVKKSITYLEQNGLEDDQVYLYYFSRFPVKYYTNLSKIDLSKFEVINNENHYRSDEYLSDLESMKGRVWFVFSNYIWPERDEIIKFKEYINPNDSVKILDLHEEKGATIILAEFK